VGVIARGCWWASEARSGVTDATGADVWSALYSPFGGAYTLTGSETLNARFPGQWFQMEAGLHYF